MHLVFKLEISCHSNRGLGSVYNYVKLHGSEWKGTKSSCTDKYRRGGSPETADWESGQSLVKYSISHKGTHEPCPLMTFAANATVKRSCHFVLHKKSLL